MGKVAVFGGSFDPVHHGHLWVARFLLDELGLKRCLFVPASWHPLKGKLGADHHRLAMLRLALQREPQFVLSEVEMDRSGPAYTYDTLVALNRMYPDWELRFVVGSDILHQFHLWHRAEELLRRFGLVVIGRDGEEVEELIGNSPLLSRHAQRIEAVAAPFAFDLSSSFIRQRLAEKKSISYLVPFEVEEYIYRHCLYGASRQACKGGSACRTWNN